LLQGDTDLGSPLVFGDGRRCTGGALKRLYVKNAAGGIVVAPTGAESSISARSADLGDRILPAEMCRYQVYYRDAAPGFCQPPAGSTFNVSQALRVLWSP
jgi:hypothetical protein